MSTARRSGRSVSLPRQGEGVSGERGAVEPPVPQRLLSTATRLFAERGYDRTSVQEIVEHAGVTKGALYHYFGSKEDLLHAVYSRLLKNQRERLERCMAAESPLQERLRTAAAEMVVASVENLDDAKIFFQSIHQLGPHKLRQVRQERQQYHERFRSLVEEGQRAGIFSTRTPADLVVDYHFGAVHHLIYWYEPGGPMSGEEIGDHMARLLLRALRP